MNLIIVAILLKALKLRIKFLRIKPFGLINLVFVDLK